MDNIQSRKISEVEVTMSIFEILNKLIQGKLTLEEAEGLLAAMINRTYRDGYDDGYAFGKDYG